MNPATVARAIPLLQLKNDENRALQYFLHSAGPSLAGIQDDALWVSLVPQLVHHDPAALYAVLAIGSMFECQPEVVLRTQHPKALNQSHSKALEWQLKSMHAYRKISKHALDEQCMERLLLGCILLVTIEFQQNNVYSAMGLLKQGSKIADLLSSSRLSNTTTTLTDVLVPALARQTVLMAVFGQPAPIDWYGNYRYITHKSLDGTASIDVARTTLYGHLWKSLHLVNSAVVAFMSGEIFRAGYMSSLYRQQSAIISELELWKKNLYVLDQRLDANTTSSERLAIITMTMYFNVAYIWASACLDETHMAYDEFFVYFNKIVDCADYLITASSEGCQPQVPFHFEMGVIAPLFFTGIHCRHPLLRRKTVHLLKNAPKQEALFVAEVCARAVEEIIKIEESDPLSDTTVNAQNVETFPSQAMRCEHVSIHYEDFNGERSQPTLIYVRGTKRTPDGKLETPAYRVPLFERK